MKTQNLLISIVSVVLAGAAMAEPMVQSVNSVSEKLGYSGAFLSLDYNQGQLLESETRAVGGRYAIALYDYLLVGVGGRNTATRGVSVELEAKNLSKIAHGEGFATLGVQLFPREMFTGSLVGTYYRGRATAMELLEDEKTRSRKFDTEGYGGAAEIGMHLTRNIRLSGTYEYRIQTRSNEAYVTKKAWDGAVYGAAITFFERDAKISNSSEAFAGN